MRLSIIAACAENRVIGKNNNLPWRLPADLRRFKKLTMGHHLIVGRRTFEAIGRPLPGRTMIVLTHRQDFRADQVKAAHSLDEALRLCATDSEAFVAGGAQVYELAIPQAQRLYLTRIHSRVEGDTYFPSYDESQWRLMWRQDEGANAENPYPFSFLIYERLGRRN